MQVHRRVERLLGRSDAGDVVHVCMCQQDMANVQVVIAHRRQQLVYFIARVDDDALTGALASHHEPVLVERRHCPDIQDHASSLVATSSSRPICTRSPGFNRARSTRSPFT